MHLKQYLGKRFENNEEHTKNFYKDIKKLIAVLASKYSMMPPHSYRVKKSK